MGFLLLPELSLLNRFAFAATRFRYFFTRSASHQTRRRFKSSIYLFTDHSFSFGSGAVATRISFIIRSATTPFASAASIIKEVNIRASVWRGLKRGTLYI